MMSGRFSMYRLAFIMVACAVVTAVSAGSALAATEPDDSIPGISRSMPFSMIGDLTFFVGDEEVGDVADVSRIWLNAGDTLRVVMRGSTGTLFHVSLLRPGTASLWDDPDDYVSSSTTVGADATQQFLRYKAPVRGLYYLMVWMQEDSPNGVYALHVKRAPVYSITRPSVPSYVKSRTRFNLTGRIEPGYFFEGKPVIVQVQKRVNGRWSKYRAYYLAYRTAPYGSSDPITYLQECRYGASATLSAGRWRTRASIGDSTMARRYSAWREFTVH